MRNAIVHAYLNLEWARIETVVMNKHYEAIGELLKTDSGIWVASN